MPTGNQEFIREINRSLVLKTIIENSPLSRADLAKRCHLTKATISAIVTELLEASLIREIGNGDTALGRKPILLEFQSGCGYTISIDIGVQLYTVLISDLTGAYRDTREYPREGAVISRKDLTDLIRSVMLLVPPSRYGVVGICLGVYGIVNEREILFTPHYRLEDQTHLCRLLEEEFRIPFFIENDANLSVFGESILHPECRNMIFLNIHSGIGSGILLDGKIFRGRRGYAGEIGHTIVVPGGRVCTCGNHGCLEQYASESAVLKAYADESALSFVTMEKFLRNYREGDPLAHRLIEDFCLYLSICINNLIFTYNPELIVLSNRFCSEIPGILDRISRNLRTGNRDQVAILSADSSCSSELLGGSSLCARSFLDSHSQNFI